jgi:broad specificity phosphatase PhoE
VGEGSPRSDLSGLASTLSIKSRLRSDHFGLTSLYPSDFLRAAPTFEFLLAGNGGANVVGFLKVHQALQELFAGKAWH